MSKFIPRILLCGDAENFLCENVAGHKNSSDAFKIAAEKFLSENAQVEIVGQIDFADEKIFLDDEEISVNTLKKILDDDADYIVFDDVAKLAAAFEVFDAGSVNCSAAFEATVAEFADRIITRDGLLRYNENFFAPTNVEILIDFIREQKISRLLDADNFFAKTASFYDTDFDVDIVDENSLTRNFPFVADGCRKIFKTLDDSRLQTYDTILLTAERNADEIFDVLVATDDMSENLLLFVRKNSALEVWLDENSVAFAEIISRSAVNGAWIFLRKHVSPEDFCVYVTAAENFPANFKTLTNNSVAVTLPDGENIDGLNRYLGELTALYRVWKNSRQKIIGFVSTEELLSADEVKKILRDSDVIVARRKIFACSQREHVTATCGEYLTEHVEKIFRKHINRIQPEYLSAFDYVGGGRVVFPPKIFVMRRKIFDAYCAWLFSFLIDVTEEVLATTNLAAVDNPQKFRVVELTAERLLTVWLLKNSLSLRELIPNSQLKRR